MPVVMPDGSILQAPLVPSASQDDCKRAKDAALERGDWDIGEMLPARVCVFRKLPNSNEHELVDVDEPGRVVNIRRTLQREITNMMKRGPLPGPLRLFHSMRPSHPPAPAPCPQNMHTHVGRCKLIATPTQPQAPLATWQTFGTWRMMKLMPGCERFFSRTNTLKKQEDGKGTRAYLMPVV